MAPASGGRCATIFATGRSFAYFHLVKPGNEKLAELRRTLQSEAEGTMQKQVLRGSH